MLTNLATFAVCVQRASSRAIQCSQLFANRKNQRFFHKKFHEHGNIANLASRIAFVEALVVAPLAFVVRRAVEIVQARVAITVGGARCASNTSENEFCQLNTQSKRDQTYGSWWRLNRTSR
jgi:hypothetical protein